VINFGTTSAQPAAYACKEPHTAAHAIAGDGKVTAVIEAGQDALSLLVAEGVVSSLRTLRTGSVKTCRTVS